MNGRRGRKVVVFKVSRLRISQSNYLVMNHEWVDAETLYDCGLGLDHEQVLYAVIVRLWTLCVVANPTTAASGR